MGKRSDFPRNKHDFYPTPPEAAEPVIDFILTTDPGMRYFFAPCAGKGGLANHLEMQGFHCIDAFDIAPQADYLNSGVPIRRFDALRWLPRLDEFPTGRRSVIITNPPWSRDLLHPMIERFTAIAPTYLLFDADWAHTKQAAYYLPHCSDIWPIGRVKWIPGSKHTGKDNACWYRFDDRLHSTVFHPREA